MCCWLFCHARQLRASCSCFDYGTIGDAVMHESIETMHFAAVVAQHVFYYGITGEGRTMGGWPPFSGALAVHHAPCDHALAAAVMRARRLQGRHGAAVLAMVRACSGVRRVRLHRQRIQAFLWARRQAAGPCQVSRDLFRAP